MKYRVGSAPQSKLRGIGNSVSGFLRSALKISLLTLLALFALPALPSVLAPGQAACAQLLAGDSPLYLDRGTGELTAEKPEGESLTLSPLEIEMLSTSSAGLTVSRRSDAVVVDLQGRFGHLATATIAPDGRLKTHCADPVASGASQ